MSRLTWAGTSEPVPRDQILRRENEDRELIHFPVQLTMSRIDNLTRLIHTLLYVRVGMMTNRLIVYCPTDRVFLGVAAADELVLVAGGV